MLVINREQIILILTDSTKDSELLESVKEKMEQADILLECIIDPLRGEPALLTPRGIFKGTGGIEFYLKRFVACS